MFRTGLIARFRLWRALRAARIFTARGQEEEAERAWRLALAIFPGATTAKFGLELSSLRRRLDAAFGVNLDVAAHTAIPALVENHGLAALEDRIDLRLASLENRLRFAETEGVIARADWQAARRHVVGRLDWLEHQFTAAAADFRGVSSEAREATHRLEVELSDLVERTRQLQSDVSGMLEHLRSVKALSRMVMRHNGDLVGAIQTAPVPGPDQPDDSGDATVGQGQARELHE